MDWLGLEPGFPAYGARALPLDYTDNWYYEGKSLIGIHSCLRGTYIVLFFFFLRIRKGRAHLRASLSNHLRLLVIFMEFHVLLFVFSGIRGFFPSILMTP